MARRPGLACWLAARLIDLSIQTNLANCASAAGCSDGELQAVTAARPWGANNPRWRLFLYGPLASLVPLRFPPPIYVLVWAGDDGREADGAPETDGGSATEDGTRRSPSCTPPPLAAMAAEGPWRPSWCACAARPRRSHRVFPEFVCNPGVICRESLP